MIPHSSVRCGGMAHMTGVLKWMATGYSGEIGREKEEMGVFLYFRSGVYGAYLWRCKGLMSLRNDHKKGQNGRY